MIKNKILLTYLFNRKINRIYGLLNMDGDIHKYRDIPIVK